MRGQINILEKEALTFEELVNHFGTMHIDGVSKKDFEKLSGQFSDLRMERESDGKITIMSPVKLGSGRREASLLSALYAWNYYTKSGEVLSSTTGFDLPDGATKSPDAAWISAEKYNLMDEEGMGYATEVPEFIAEIRSSTDRLTALKKKMNDTWMKNGVRLAWLIDPYGEQVFIYRENGEEEIIEGFSEKKLSGEDVLPDFELDLELFQLRK